ncbi:MAG: hypothetical protein ACOH2P_03230 [Pseudomonas sp.]
MADKSSFAILPAINDQPSIVTRHPASFQDAITGAASIAEQWMASPSKQSLVDLLDHWKERMPGSARAPFQEAFLMRLEQRLRTLAVTNQMGMEAPNKEMSSANSSDPDQSVGGHEDE